MLVRAISLLSVCIVVISIVAVFLIGRSYSVSDAQSQQDAMHARLQLVHGRIIKDLTLVERVSRIQTVLKTRSLLTGTLAILQKQIPQNVSLETVSITATTVTMLVSSNSVSDLQTCIDSFTKLVDKKVLFSKLTINNVVVDAVSGRYTVNMQGSLL